MRSWRARLISGYILALVMAGTSACSMGTSESGLDERPQFSGTRTEHQIAVVECVRDAGIEVELLKDEGGDGYGFSKTSDEPFEEVAALLDDCTSEIGFPPPEPVTDEDFQVQFEGRVADYGCLTAAGFDVPEPPSFAAYVEEARGYGELWHPWDLLQPVPAEALEVCPRDADTWWR